MYISIIFWTGYFERLLREIRSFKKTLMAQLNGKGHYGRRKIQLILIRISVSCTAGSPRYISEIKLDNWEEGRRYKSTRSCFELPENDTILFLTWLFLRVLIRNDEAPITNGRTSIASRTTWLPAMSFSDYRHAACIPLRSGRGRSLVFLI